MDGVELIQRIRRHPAITGLPCIAVTAYNSTTLKRQAIEAGYNRYYAKPINPDEVVQELHRLLA
jgi:CheY-like chemotaxis protein